MGPFGVGYGYGGPSHEPWGAGLGWPGFWYKSKVPKDSESASKRGILKGYAYSPYLARDLYYRGASFRSQIPGWQRTRRGNALRRWGIPGIPAGFGYPGWGYYGHPGLGFWPGCGIGVPVGGCFRSAVPKGDETKRGNNEASKKCGFGGCGCDGGCGGGCGGCGGGYGGCGGGCGGCGGGYGGWGEGCGWGGPGWGDWGYGHGLGGYGGLGYGFGGWGHGFGGWGHGLGGWGHGLGGWGWGHPGFGFGCCRSKVSKNSKAPFAVKDKAAQLPKEEKTKREAESKEKTTDDKKNENCGCKPPTGNKVRSQPM